MLDWHKAVEELGDTASEVHVVSTGNECKELLFVLGSEAVEDVKVFCINDEQRFEFSGRSGLSSHSIVSSPSCGTSSCFLYEPNASIMKAGCFELVAQHYGVVALAPNSHLFVSEEFVEDFPGRSFAIAAISQMNKQSLKQHLQGIKQANIAVRNFPESVATLRKRLKISDGGDTYIFATTLSNGERRLFICKKVNLIMRNLC